MGFSHQSNNKRRGATALLAFTFCVAGAHSALAQPSREPIRTFVPVFNNTTSGDITVGNTTWAGRNPGMNMVALKRRPNVNSLGAPDLVEQQVVTDSNNASSFLQYVLQNSPDTLVIVNATWNFGFSLDSIASDLEQFGSGNPIDPGSPAFVFIGNGGLRPLNACGKGLLQFEPQRLSGGRYNNNYKFIQRHR